MKETQTPNSVNPVWYSDRDLAARYGVSRITPWRWSRDKSTGFPRPHKLGPNTSRWSAAEIEAYDRRAMEAEVA